MQRLLSAATVGASGGAASSSTTLAPPHTVTIASGVHMPLLNMGVVRNHSAWLAMGGRGLDTALTYGDEDQADVGRAVRDSGLPRSQLFVTTKVPCCPSKSFCEHYDPAVLHECHAGLPPRNYTRDVETDLRVLGLSYVDLLLLHWPCDSMAQSVRAYRALEPLVHAGKARAIGVSNFNASALATLLAHVSVVPAVNQCGFSVGVRHSRRSPPSLWGSDEDTVAVCRAAGVTYSAYSPLGGNTRYDVLHDPTVEAVAAAHNRSTAQVALRYLAHRGIPLVTASDSPAHVASDLAVFGFALTEREVATMVAA